MLAYVSQSLSLLAHVSLMSLSLCWHMSLMRHVPRHMPTEKLRDRYVSLMSLSLCTPVPCGLLVGTLKSEV